MERTRIGRRSALALLVAIAAAVGAACGGGGGGETAASAPPTSTIDPLTVTIPPSPLDPTLPAEDGTLRLVGAPSLAMDLWRVAARRGYPAREGLRLQLPEDAEPAAVADALASGAADAAVVPAHVALALGEEGLLISLPAVLTASKDRHAIVVPEGVDGVAALAGAEVAVRDVREDELLVRAAAAEAGLPADAIAVVRVDDPLAALRRGEVAAAVASGAEVEPASLEAGEPLVALTTAGAHPGLLAEVLVVRDDVLRERPGQVMALLRVWQDLFDADREEPERLAVDLAAVTGRSAEEELAILVGSMVYDVVANAIELVPGGEFHDTRLLQVRDLSAEAGWLAGDVDARGLLDWLPVQAVASAR